MLTGLVQSYLSGTLHYHYWKVYRILLGLSVMLLFLAALEMPEIMPMGDHQGEVEDKEWQRWLQELFCCGEIVIIREKPNILVNCKHKGFLRKMNLIWFHKNFRCSNNILRDQ